MARRVRPKFYVKSTTSGETHACASALEVLAFRWGKRARQWSVYKLVTALLRDGEALIARLEEGSER